MTSDFYIRKICPSNVKDSLEDIGFDPAYINTASGKYSHNLIKIHNLSCPQATIIKQLALSLGADAAVHREVITCKTEKSDVIISATDSQIKNLYEKLQKQPFKLPILSEMLKSQISETKLVSTIDNREIDWSQKTYLMGILNVTPDSFSDGGLYSSGQDAIKHALNLIDQGADIIDVGGESTRPYAQKVEIEEEIKRVIPVIKSLREADKDILISIDTRNAKTAKKAIEAGANIVNDVSGFDWDTDMIKTVSELQVPVIIMHSLSDPTQMQKNPSYKNVVDEVFQSLSDKIQKAIHAGIKKENIIIDPGIGFGKTLEHNIELVKRIAEFSSLKVPVLVGISRKSIISKIINTPPDQREEATIALNSYLASNGTNILRVHDIEKNYKALKVLDAIIK